MDKQANQNNWVSMVEEARERIAGFAIETPVALIADEPERFESVQLYLKLENLQKTGSFKLRGAANKVLSLTAKEAAQGVVTSSAGNHGVAVAASAHRRGIDAEVFLCQEVSLEKARWIEGYGARVRQIGKNPLDAELAARAAAEDSGRTYVSPYNDPLVVAGQGTVALELGKQVPHLDAIYVAVGGGGLISGIGAWLNSVSPQTEVIGCWPENARVLYESLRAGRIIEFPETPTLSESTAGGVEPGSVTFELCQKFVRRKVLVSEPEILNAMRWAKKKGWIVEGAAGVAIAAFFKEARHYQGKTVVVVCCGGNLLPEVASQLS
jgi:threonine dehydratase